MASFPRIIVAMFVGGFLLVGIGNTADSEGEAVQLQEQLNKGVLSKPFSVEEQAKLDAYIKDNLNKSIVPSEYTGTHWRRGYTCGDLRSYSWGEYRDCMYYYRYYGHYYPW